MEFLCIQESKKTVFDKVLCQILWGESDLMWLVNLIINFSRGLLCIWTKECLEVKSHYIGEGFIEVEGVWKEGGWDITLINVFSTCDLSQQKDYEMS